MQKDAFAFSKPVNPVTSKCPDYLDIIKRPMDLGTVQKKFPGKGKPTEKSPGKQEYKSPEEFRDDVRLVWSNCRTYNAVGHAVRTMGDSLSEIWEKKWALSGIETKWEEEMRRQELEEQVLTNIPAYPIRALGLLTLLLLSTAAPKQFLCAIPAGACRGSQSSPAAASSGQCPAGETGAHRKPAWLLSPAGGRCHELRAEAAIEHSIGTAPRRESLRGHAYNCRGRRHAAKGVLTFHQALHPRQGLPYGPSKALLIIEFVLVGGPQ